MFGYAKGFTTDMEYSKANAVFVPNLCQPWRQVLVVSWTNLIKSEQVLGKLKTTEEINLFSSNFSVHTDYFSALNWVALR